MEAYAMLCRRHTTKDHTKSLGCILLYMLILLGLACLAFVFSLGVVLELSVWKARTNTHTHTHTPTHLPATRDVLITLQCGTPFFPKTLLHMPIPLGVVSFARLVLLACLGFAFVNGIPWLA